MDINRALEIYEQVSKTEGYKTWYVEAIIALGGRIKELETKGE